MFRISEVLWNLMSRRFCAEPIQEEKSQLPIDRFQNDFALALCYWNLAGEIAAKSERARFYLIHFKIYPSNSLIEVHAISYCENRMS